MVDVDRWELSVTPSPSKSHSQPKTPPVDAVALKVTSKGTVPLTGVASITASRGQSRIISLSLKLSEAKEIKNITERKPILILDDIFSELDEKMRTKVVTEILDFDQILLSTADISLIDKTKIMDGKYFSINDGKVNID